MKDHPILFSSDMVRAILEGRKTMTRRVVKPQPFRDGPFWAVVHRNPMRLPGGKVASELRTNDVAYLKATLSFLPCPYGVPGDRLWVRETFEIACAFDKPLVVLRYPANDERKIFKVASMDAKALKMRLGNHPSIHMPKWACRLWLEITDVRVERLQEISEEDAKAEGVANYAIGHGRVCSADEPILQIDAKYKHGFRELWDSLYANRGYSWDSNPWVWALTFKRIDAAPAAGEQGECYEHLLRAIR